MHFSKGNLFLLYIYKFEQSVYIFVEHLTLYIQTKKSFLGAAALARVCAFADEKFDSRWQQLAICNMLPCSESDFQLYIHTPAIATSRKWISLFNIFYNFNKKKKENLNSKHICLLTKLLFVPLFLIPLIHHIFFINLRLNQKTYFLINFQYVRVFLISTTFYSLSLN